VHNLPVLTKRELEAYFFSPLAYTILVVFLIIQGIVFWMILNALNHPVLQANINAIQFFLGGSFFFWFTLVVICPIITMRLFSEEKRSGTIEVLMTAPVSDLEVVLSKFFASLIYYMVLWIPTGLYVVFIKQHQPALDLGPVFTGYLGVFLLGAFFLSIGCLASSLTRNQVIAAALSFGFLLFLLSAGFLSYFLREWGISDLLGYISISDNLSEFTRGVLDTRWIVLYVTGIVFNLFITLRVVESMRWR
jgi:ABC-2 type transport system permease protein